MLTVMDHVSPWFIPNSTLAAMTHPQEGAQINISGTGIANSHPDNSIRRRVSLWESLPAKRLVAQLTPFFEVPLTTVFDLTGIDQVGPQILEPCEG